MAEPYRVWSSSQSVQPPVDPRTRFTRGNVELTFGLEARRTWHAEQIYEVVSVEAGRSMSRSGGLPPTRSSLISRKP